MAGKNGSNGAHDPIGDSVEKVLKLYDLIKQAEDIAREPVEVPEWGVTVWVRTLSGDDRDAFEHWVAVRRQEADGERDRFDARGFRAMVAIFSTTDEAGNRLFTTADADWLGQKSGEALDRIFTAADRLSGFSGSAKETARGNSDATPSAGSPTG